MKCVMEFTVKTNACITRVTYFQSYSSTDYTKKQFYDIIQSMQLQNDPFYSNSSSLHVPISIKHNKPRRWSIISEFGPHLDCDECPSQF